MFRFPLGGALHFIRFKVSRIMKLHFEIYQRQHFPVLSFYLARSASNRGYLSLKTLPARRWTTSLRHYVLVQLLASRAAFASARRVKQLQPRKEVWDARASCMLGRSVDLVMRAVF